jgi:ribosomal peptide maturation radical SAM protein 1
MPALSLPVVGPDRPSLNESLPSARATAKRVLLLCPPFQSLSISSLAVAHLATWLRSQGISCGEAYLHFDFARIVGEEKYNLITNAGTGLRGELLFAEGLHGKTKDAETEAVLSQLYGPSEQRLQAVAELGKRCLDRVTADRPDLVGFSTSFSQLLPSLWLARIIKQEYPDIQIVLGGAACSEPMGQRVLQGYPDIDYAVSGYGERPLLTLCHCDPPKGSLLQGHEPPDLDGLPIPEYEQFLSDAGDFAEANQLALAFESSRGCWWGQKNHCTFCGLNGVEMRFAAKSSQRVVSEIRTLWDRYGRNLYATDTILSREHLRTVMGELATFETGPALFYEVKSNMVESDIVALKRAKATTLQPGIESLSTHLLTLLKKGVSTIRNLALLKWCRERGIHVLWNLLCAIPGEKTEDYDQQLLLFDKIPQLQPPYSVNPVRIDRFSPYFKSYVEFGWQRIEPFPEYRLLHPHFSDEALHDVAYHFNGLGGITPGPYLKRLRAAVKDWTERFKQNDGLFLDPEKGLVRNESGHGMRYGLPPALQNIVDLTHDITPIDRLLAETGCPRTVIDQLVKANVLFVEGDKVLNLAIRVQPPEF